MPAYLLSHRHAPGECARVFAAWRGFQSPLRHEATISSCLQGGHRLWWRVEAESPAEALVQLPPFVAERTEATEVSVVEIP